MDEISKQEILTNMVFKIWEQEKIGTTLTWTEFWYGQRLQSLDETLGEGSDGANQPT